MPPPTPIRLKLIGAPAVSRDGTPLRLPTRKTLALLALLAIVGRLPRATVAERLWSALEPGAARRNLRRELHRLREAGLAELVRDEDDRLALGASVDCDAWRFAEALATGDAVAAAAFGAGPLLDGLDVAEAAGFEEWLAAERARHVERWCDAAERHAGALEAQGRTREAVALLASIVERDPVREASVRAAMRCHARLGTPEPALALFERLDRRLHDDLGLAPLPETRALAAALRAGGRETGAAPPAPRASDPLPARAPFVGREETIRRLELAWEAERVIVLVAEAGLGKTRIAGDFAAAHGAHAHVPCRPADGGIPYASAARALRALVASGDPGVVPAWAAVELTRLLPEIGPAPPPLQSAEDRARFVAGIATAWSALLQGNFASVVVDDWHYADDASADLLVHLAQRMHDARAGSAGAQPRLLIVSRPMRADAPAQTALARLAESGLAERFALAPLGPAELQLLVQRLSGAAGATLFSRRLHRATGGNPLFAIETLRHLFEIGLLSADPGGGWRTPFDEDTIDYRELPVPASVRETVLARVRALGEAALRLLEAASLAGDPFTLARLDGTTALSEFERVAAIETALGAQVLVGADAPDNYRFSHDLFAQAVADSVSGVRARLLHRRLAATAEALGLPPARVAAHWQAAGDAARALPWRRSAADAAERAFAHAEALEQLTLALPLASAAEERVRLQLRRAALARLRLDGATAEAALADARAGCAGALPERHAVTVALAQLRIASDAIDDALSLLDTVVGDPAASPEDRAEALLARAAAHQKRGSGRTVADLEAAIALLPAGPSAQRARALTGLGNSAMRQGDHAKAGAHFAAAAREFDTVGDLAGRANAVWREGATLMLRGDLAAATALLERGLAEAAQAHHVGHQRGAILNLVKVCTQTGELDRAARLIARGMELSPAFSAPAEETAFRQAAYYVAYLRGELGQALALAEQAIAHADGTAEVYWKVGARLLVLDLALHLGDVARAERWLEEAEALDRAHELGYHRALLVAKRAWLELERGDAGSALARLDALAAGAERPVGEDALVLEHLRARVLLALGRPADAAVAVQAPAERSALDAWTLRSAMHIAAERRLGAVHAGRLEALDAEDAAHRLPPLESLVLAEELRAAFAALGQRHAAERARRRAVARRRRLAATLPDAAARERWLGQARDPA